MELSTRQVILLHMLHLTPQATVITLVDQVAPFYPKANPPSQQSVRDQLKVLLAAGLVELAHKGKPRTYLRTPRSYLLLPASRPPPQIHNAAKRERRNREGVPDRSA